MPNRRQAIKWTNADPVHWYIYPAPGEDELTHWGRVTHICVSKLTIIGSDNGLSPGRRLAIIWTNAGILLIGPLGTNFSEKLIEIQTFSFKKMDLKMSSGKWQPSCLGLNVLNKLWLRGSGGQFLYHCQGPLLTDITLYDETQLCQFNEFRCQPIKRHMTGDISNVIRYSNCRWTDYLGVHHWKHDPSGAPFTNMV